MDFSHNDLPILKPWANKKVFAIPPPTKSMSNSSVKFSNTFSFVDILDPPIIPNLFPSLALRALLIINISCSKYLPEYEGR